MQAHQPSLELHAISAATRLVLLAGLGAGASLALAQAAPASAAAASAAAAAQPAPGATSPAQAAAALPAVTVRAQAASGPVPYEGGQVASGGRVGFLGDKDFMQTPFSTISYTSQFVENRQAQDIGQVIAATDASVFSNGVSGAWSDNYSIRGFAAATQDATFDGLAGMAPYYRTSPEMFERIEVLKGPSALLNGMPPGGSVGGTINLAPKRAGSAPLTRVSATYMSDAQLGGHVDIGRRFGPGQQFGLRFNGVYRGGDGPVTDQKKKTRLAALGLDWRGSRARLSLDLYGSHDHVDGVTRGISLAPGLAVPRPPRADTLLNPSWSFVTNKDRAAIARGEFDISPNWMAYAALGRSHTDYRYNGAMSAQVTDAQGNFRHFMGQLHFKVAKTSADIGLRGKFQTGGLAHQLTLNATHYHHDQNDYGRRNVPGAEWDTNIYNPRWSPSAPPFVAPHIFKTALRLQSIGLADTLSLADGRAQITLGLRRQQVVSDSFNPASGARISRYDQSATSPAVAALFRASDRLSVYANYIEGLSQGATAPNSAANAGEIFPPYKSKQKEIGLKFDAGRFAHTLSLYEIARPGSYTDPATNVFSFGGQQRNRGVEWNFFGAPMSGLRLMGGMAYVQPRMTRTAGGLNQGKQATGVPRLQAKLGAEWDVPALPGLTLTANASAVSRQYISADNRLYAPGRAIFDVGARYAMQVGGRPVTLRASVHNVANKAYWGMPLLSSLALGAPRTFLLSASVDF